MDVSTLADRTAKFLLWAPAGFLLLAECELVPLKVVISIPVCPFGCLQPAVFAWPMF